MVEAWRLEQIRANNRLVFIRLCVGHLIDRATYIYKKGMILSREVSKTIAKYLKAQLYFDLAVETS